jgi:hypothetical protein
MATVVIRIDMPAKGSGVTGTGSSPTDEQMKEELAARKEFLDFVEPKLASLLERPARRAGNIHRIDLWGGGEWSRLTNYLLLVSVDIGNPGIDFTSVLPPGGEASAIDGSYGPLLDWAKKDGVAPRTQE